MGLAVHTSDPGRMSGPGGPSPLALTAILSEGFSGEWGDKERRKLPQAHFPKAHREWSHSLTPGLGLPRATGLDGDRATLIF